MTTDESPWWVAIWRQYVSHDRNWLSSPNTAAGFPELPFGLGCLAMAAVAVMRNGRPTVARSAAKPGAHGFAVASTLSVSSRGTANVNG